MSIPSTAQAPEKRVRLHPADFSSFLRASAPPREPILSAFLNLSSLRKPPGKWLRRIGSSRTLSRLVGPTGVATILRLARRVRRNLWPREIFVCPSPQLPPAQFDLLQRRIERLRRAGWQVQEPPTWPEATFVLPQIIALTEQWKARARSKFLSAEQEPHEMGRRLIEHGAMCYFNCAQELGALIPQFAAQPSTLNSQL